MENISLGQITAFITFIVAVIGAITSLIAFSKTFVAKILKPINQKIEQFEKIATKGRNNIELELIKIILANFINDMESGLPKSDIQKKNAYELYDRYQTLGGNSYIHDCWEKLIKEGKI